MRAAITLLVLLLSMCGAQSTQTEVQTESQSTGATAAAEVSTQLDVNAELKALRDIVMEQGIVLAELKMTELTAMKTRLAATEAAVENLEKKTETSKLAFSAGLLKYTGTITAGSADRNLVFTFVFTDVGGAYSSTTGFFTAPVRGVYYFRFTVADHMTSQGMAVYLAKNGQKLVQPYLNGADGSLHNISGGLTLQLEVGDVVNLGLVAGFRLYDDALHRSTFSGFLIFTL